jgi:hypothetical protein
MHSWDLANKGKIFGLETGSKIIIEKILHFFTVYIYSILILSARTYDGNISKVSMTGGHDYEQLYHCDGPTSRRYSSSACCLFSS